MQVLIDIATEAKMAVLVIFGSFLGFICLGVFVYAVYVREPWRTKRPPPRHSFYDYDSEG